LKVLKGGFFLRKKPFEYVLSVYGNSENAIGAVALLYTNWRTAMGGDC
jgi:hypothetical protein